MNKKILLLLGMLIALAVGAAFIQQKSLHPSFMNTANHSISVKDSTKETVSLDKPAKKVIALTASDGELLLRLGVKPVGVVLSKDMPESVNNELKEYPLMGSASGPSMERILQTNPDLVIGVAMPFQTSLRKTLTANNIPSYFHLPRTYDEIMKQILDIGAMTGHEDKAEALVASYDKELKMIQNKNRGRKQPRVIIVFGTPVSYYLATSNSYVGDMFKKLGAINAADQYIKPVSATDKEKAADVTDGFIALNLETMSVLDADKVLIIMHGSSEGAKEAFKKAFRNPAWSNIPAIQKGEIYVLPGDLFSTIPTARMNDVLNYGEEVLYGKGK